MSEATVTRLPRAAAPKAQSVADRIRNLQAEAAALSKAQVEELVATMMECAQHAAQVAENPSQPAGVRDLARRLVDDIDASGRTITAIISRSA